MTDELVEIATDTVSKFLRDMFPEWDGDQSDCIAENIAAAILAAVTPEIEARVTGEIGSWLRELATHSTKYGPTTIADNLESGHFARWTETQRRGDHKESQP